MKGGPMNGQNEFFEGKDGDHFQTYWTDLTKRRNIPDVEALRYLAIEASGVRRTRLISTKMAEIVWEQPAKKVLDAGISRFSSEVLFAHGASIRDDFDAILVDHDSNSISQCRKALSWIPNQQISFIEQDISQTLPIEDGEVDVINCQCLFDVIHSNLITQVISNFHRILSSGGKAVIAIDINKEAEGIVAAENRERYQRTRLGSGGYPTTYERHLDFYRIRLKRKGFRIVEEDVIPAFYDQQTWTEFGAVALFLLKK